MLSLDHELHIFSRIEVIQSDNHMTIHIPHPGASISKLYLG